MKNKRKICLIIFLILLLFIFTLNIAKYYKNPFRGEENKIIGIIDVSNNDYSVVNKYYKHNKMDEINIGGTEKYLIVPKNTDVTFKIYKLVLEDNGNVNRILKSVTRRPFYITCNESDIFPNTLIEIYYKDETYEYSPYISLKDGSLYTKDFVLNIK